MPNWCDNQVTVEGDQSVLDDLMEAAERNELLTFMVPPPDFKTTPVPLAFPEIKAEYAKTEEEKAEILKNEPAIRDNSWWNWCVKNWGTKWDLDFKDSGGVGLSPDGKKLFLSFSSAWAPPVEAFHNFMDRNKDKDIDVQMLFYEPGCDFVGEFRASNREDFRDEQCLKLGALEDDFFLNDPLGQEMDEAFNIMEDRIWIREENAAWEKRQAEKKAEEEKKAELKNHDPKEVNNKEYKEAANA